MNFLKVVGSRQCTRAVKSIVTRAMVRPMSGGHYHDPLYKPFHFDDMPVPDGPWQADYDKRNRKYNTALFIGVTVLSLTVNFLTQSGVVFFNACYPTLPELEEEPKKD